MLLPVAPCRHGRQKATSNGRTLPVCNRVFRPSPSRPGPRAPIARIRLRQAGVDPDRGVPMRERKPTWARAPVVLGRGYRSLGRTMRDLDLVTVCEEAGCPNIYECWSEGTATFMINGDRCTRACGFCLVDTSRPLPVDPGEPDRVAQAVSRMGLAHAVVTAVARDDVPDGGAGGFAATVLAIRKRCPGTSVELLIPDCKGDTESLDVIFTSRPEVLNHNLETVARLQRAVRPSAGYARSLAVLARAHKAGLVTKSGLILGMGEEVSEVRGALMDLKSVGVKIVTLGQYLRPSASHIPVSALVDSRGVHRDRHVRTQSRLRPCGVVATHALELSRPKRDGIGGGRDTRHDRECSGEGDCVMAELSVDSDERVRKRRMAAVHIADVRARRQTRSDLVPWR